MIDHNVRQVVKPEDILIHLGDVGMDKENSWADTVRNWPGHKWLVLGNHDGKSAQWYVDKGIFDMAATAILYRGVWLTHHPWTDPLPQGANVNVHGHLHNVWDGFLANDPAQRDEFSAAYESGRLPREYNRLFSVEYTNYMPVEFDKFVAKGHRLYKSRGPLWMIP